MNELKDFLPLIDFIARYGVIPLLIMAWRLHTELWKIRLKLAEDYVSREDFDTHVLRYETFKSGIYAKLDQKQEKVPQNRRSGY